MSRHSRDLAKLVLPPPLFTPQKPPAPAILPASTNGVLQESNQQRWEVVL